MKRLLLLFVLLFLFLFTFTTIAQKDCAIGKSIEYSFPEKIQKPMGEPLPAGTYSIGSGGYFTTIQSAFNKLSIDGVAGAVNLELIDNLYTAPTDSFGFFLNGPIPGAGLNSRVTIKPAENKNVTIQGDGFGTITFLNTSYVTVDGINLTGPTTLTMHTLPNSTFLYNEGIVFFNNCDHNVMQNITFINEDITRISGSCFWGNNTSSEAPDSNLIQNNFVKQAGIGFFISVDYTAVRGIGNIIRGNKVGSETDSLIAWGIQVENCQNTIIEDNIVQNLRFYNNYSNPGINSLWGNGDIIRNNVVHNIHASGGIFGGIGILLSGTTGKPGSNNLVYNNMVYDIRSSSTVPQSTVAGIQMWQQINPKIYYNSVYLNGNGNGANSDGSAALYIYYACTNVEAKDNILVNIRDESPYCASAIYDNTIANLSSDYNDLFYQPSTYSALVRIGGTKYNTLAGWQATGKDLNSITEMPNFVSLYLHINVYSSTAIDSGAIPIPGITNDFDGNLRNTTTPDIGADEFDWAVPVELTSFTATSNGEEVILNWTTATETNNSGFSIERKSANTEYAEIGFVPGFGTTTEPRSYSYTDSKVHSGKYKYRLKQIDFDGTYNYSKVIEVTGVTVSAFRLEQNYPNPFNPTTTIKYSIPEAGRVSLTLISLLGEEVMTLVNEEKPEGDFTIRFNASNLSSGVYFYQLKAGKYISTKKMILLK